ncbi:probable WRKY transcription factor 4 isoform X1 [Phoenix dactylifera]|uniref:Probable WRKY transcription factor 4 isoform X1 n=1 Tax=Phoenix dactylifera TaxID=42345 RepID=A0A8B9AEB5_PHODC|nr:probable WRKY transcription factor 4 isoform X1 [Phoenix dactylifera]
MAEEPGSGAPEHDKADREGSPESSSCPPLEAEGGDSKTLGSPDSSSQPGGDGGSAGDRRSFSQLLAGAMASAAPGSAGVAPFLTVPVVTIPCYIAPAAGLAGQFAMTHQAVLASVMAQALMQLQKAYPSSSSEFLRNSVTQPQISNITLLPLQQDPLPVAGNNACAPQMEQPPSSDQKPQSASIVVKTSSDDEKTSSDDDYNWRKYGQKQVKNSENIRSYYRCAYANCSVKKKVECCQDGHVADIVYSGCHNHEPPLRVRSSRERKAKRSAPSVVNKKIDLPGAENNATVSSASKLPHSSGNETLEQHLPCSDGHEGDSAVKTEEDLGDKPDPKRRSTENTILDLAPVLKTIRETKVILQTACDVSLTSDGYRWRKYGRKFVKGNPNPRSYYRCTHIGCPVRKHVERSSEDAKSLLITYEGKHNHELPPLKDGSNPPDSALLTAAAATAMTTNEQTPKNVPLLYETPTTKWLPDVDGKVSNEQVQELGGEKAIESAQTLLTMGLSATSENAGSKNSGGIQQPRSNGNCAIVPVENS